MILEEFNNDLVILTKKMIYEIQRNWRAIYSERVFQETGKWTLGGFEWNIFHQKYYQSLSGYDVQVAIENLSKENFFTKGYYCLSADNSITTGCYVPEIFNSDIIKGEEDIHSDTLYCDIEYQWTCLVTHENDIGPFLAFK